MTLIYVSCATAMRARAVKGQMRDVGRTRSSDCNVLVDVTGVHPDLDSWPSDPLGLGIATGVQWHIVIGLLGASVGDVVAEVTGMPPETRRRALRNVQSLIAHKGASFYVVGNEAVHIHAIHERA